MSDKKAIRDLIVDAGPILKNEPSADTLLAKTENLLTTPRTISEIRDVNARQRIETQLLPFIKLVEPKQSSVEFVSSFAKKTGDFSALSRTDLELLALTYEKEIERNGAGRLCTAPGQRPSKPPRKRNRRRKHKGENATKSTEAEPQQSGPLRPENAVSLSATIDVSKPEAIEPALESLAPEDTVVSSSASDTLKSEATDLALESDLQALHLSSLNAAVLSSKQQPSPQNDVNQEPQPAVDQISQPSDTRTTRTDVAQDPESDSADDWITPDNLQQHQEKDVHGSTAPLFRKSNIQVACLTTDYAMQNVLLQIGLHILSPNMQRIKQIRTYILRCYACFQQVKDTSKQFCPRCGNPTLTRVSCSTDDKGQFHLHLKKKMEWHHRGDRYSIPKPVHGSASGKAAHAKGGGKGGWGQQLILTEDQKEYQRAVGSQDSRPRDVVDEDYLPDILTGKRSNGWVKPKIGAGRNVNSRKRTT